jgi:hypothetical protein
MTWKIKHLENGEIETLHRDVAHKHPAWVHEQMGTRSETELQMTLDSYRASDYYRGDEFLGPDVAGIYPA